MYTKSSLLTLSLIIADSRLDFVPVIAKVMCQLGRGRSAVDIGHQDVVTDLFTKFIKAVGSSASAEDKDTPQLKQVQILGISW